MADEWTKCNSPFWNETPIKEASNDAFEVWHTIHHAHQRT